MCLLNPRLSLQLLRIVPDIPDSATVTLKSSARPKFIQAFYYHSPPCCRLLLPVLDLVLMILLRSHQMMMLQI